MSKRFCTLCITLVPVPATLPDIAHSVAPERAPFARKVVAGFCHVYLRQKDGAQPDGVPLKLKALLSFVRLVQPEVVCSEDIKKYPVCRSAQLTGKACVNFEVKHFRVFGDLSGIQCQLTRVKRQREFIVRYLVFAHCHGIALTFSPGKGLPGDYLTRLVILQAGAQRVAPTAPQLST